MKESKQERKQESKKARKQERKKERKKERKTLSWPSDIQGLPRLRQAGVTPKNPHPHPTTHHPNPPAGMYSGGKDTPGSQKVQFGLDIFSVSVGRDPEGVDDGVGAVGEAGQVGGGQARADVHVENIITSIDEAANGLRPHAARLVLNITSHPEHNILNIT